MVLAIQGKDEKAWGYLARPGERLSVGIGWHRSSIAKSKLSGAGRHRPRPQARKQRELHRPFFSRWDR